MEQAQAKPVFTEQKGKTTAHILAMLCILVWGSTFVCTDILLGAMSPIQIITFRTAIGYALAWITCPKWSKLKLKDELVFLGLGVTGGSAYFACENYAIKFTNPSNVSIIISIAPLIVVLMSRIFIKGTRLYRNLLIGAGVSFLGVVLVVMNGSLVLKIGPGGDLLALAAAVIWGFYNLLLVRVMDRYDGKLITRKVMFYSAITCYPMMLIEGQPINWAGILQFKILAILAFMTVVGSVGCYLMWHSSTKKLGVVTTNNYLYATPFVTLVVDVLVRPEARITWMGILGAVLTVGGVLISSRVNGRRKDAAAVPLTDGGEKQETGAEKQQHG